MILVVEDDVVTGRVFQNVLEKQGYKVQLARDCATANSLIVAHLFSLICVDLMLPDGDGLELVRSFRAHPELMTVPIIMCTASEEEEVYRRAFEAGATDFIRKPARPTELLARVANALSLQDAKIQIAGLLQSKTMAAMAALVAHEINNPLTAAYHSLGVLNGHLPELDECKRYAKLLMEVLNRIKALVVDLRTVALVDESVEARVTLSESSRLACLILGTRGARGTWARVNVVQDFELFAHPGWQAQALVAMGGHWLDFVESLGGGGLEFVVGALEGERQIHLVPSLLEGWSAELSYQVPSESYEVLLARRYFKQTGASVQILHAEEVLPKLVISWPKG